MSSGSYDYLYCKSFEDIVTHLLNVNDDELYLKMIAALKKNNCTIAAGKFQDLILKAMEMVETIKGNDKDLEKLSGVLQAVEFHESNDWGPTAIQQAYLEYLDTEYPTSQKESPTAC